MKAWPDLDSTASPPWRLDDLDGVPGEARIVHDLAAARLAAQQHRGQQPDDVIALDEAALLIEEEAAVEIPVPGEPEIRAVGADRRDGRRAILLDHGVRDAVGKAAVGLVVDLDELERQVRLEPIDDQPRRRRCRHSRRSSGA